MSEVINVRRTNGTAKGKLTIKDDRSYPSKPVLGQIVFEDVAGNEAVIDFAAANAASTLGAEVVADSVAADVATLVTDFNALLAVLRTANVIATA